MDNAMVLLTAETKYIRLDIAGFQSCVMGLEQRVTMVEAQAATSQDWDQELLYLRSKLTDLEDRSRRDNVRFLWFPETIEGEDMHLFLLETLPKLTDITFDPPLEFHRAHRLGPKRPGATARPDRSEPVSSITRKPDSSYNGQANTGPVRWTARRSGYQRASPMKPVSAGGLSWPCALDYARWR
ncbi:hypothetical protein NDU88_002608 [Pleurodeles waltl]|uniref:Uncharacterized protein n=1 Tax=Pleurodeles waltl TaxID=8319 RepID=A0AAV7P9V9_PLEWA|nr:hypothetical protein NDU88_002608 [Pleurodeles waltl]